MSDYNNDMSKSRSNSGTFNRNPKMQHLRVPGQVQSKSNRNSPYTTPISSPNRQKYHNTSHSPASKSINNSTDTNNSTIQVIPSEKFEPERKRVFKKEITQMMVGFGEKNAPYEDSINLLSDIVENFIGDMARQACQVGKPGKINIEDILYLVRHDAKKNSRAFELMRMNEKIKKAKKAIEVDEKDIAENEANK